MTARPDPRQFDLFAQLEPPAPLPVPPAAAVDDGAAMLARVVEAGLADSYSVGFRYHPSVPRDVVLDGIWATPSRLFRHPYSFKLADDTRPDRIVVQHPLLVDHPHVQALAAFTGWPVMEAVGSDAWGNHGLWHHAVDLVSAGRWQLLLETQSFTTRGHILSAISYGLDYGPHDGDGRGKSHLSLSDARAMLLAMDAAEPGDRSRSVIEATRFDENVCDGKKQRVTQWPRLDDAAAAAWARVHAIEAGFLKMSRLGFLNWTDKVRTAAGAML